ncbi:MAG: hypothetical protein PUH25_10225 [Spirochaetales bacterium]|nr:hypothetical protein [Spirochaetales bacterium]
MNKQMINDLLASWCEALYSHLLSSQDKRIDGAIICPACGKIHGRCFEAMYPFLEMARQSGDEKWINASIKLFSWAEHTVTLPDGGYLNDIDSDWTGTSVFECIVYLDVLFHYSDLLSKDFLENLKKRTFKLAKYILDNKSLRDKNTNYPVSAAYALYRAGEYFNNESFFSGSKEFEKIIYSVFTPNYLVFGEGFGRDRRSDKNLLSIDIGYNVEETLPAITLLGFEKKDEKLLSLAEKGFLAHLKLFLSDGGWDNSFGTRDFKWTYWGSRTSDGAAEALFLLSDRNPIFAKAAYKNIELMKNCTHNGLLYGGIDLEKAGQSPCIHHTFTHAKVLAGIIRRDIAQDIDSIITDSFPRYSTLGLSYLSDADTYIYSSPMYSATVTAYDWPHMVGGHTSGGMLSLFEVRDKGPVIVSGMGRYYLKEKNNMQTPFGDIKHECPDFRIDNGAFSSRYSVDAVMKSSENIIFVEGFLTSEVGEKDSPYSIEYEFLNGEIKINVKTIGELVIPIANGSWHLISYSNNSVKVEKDGIVFELNRTDEGSIIYPYGSTKVLSLVPGIVFLKTVMKAVDGCISLEMKILKGRK